MRSRTIPLHPGISDHCCVISAERQGRRDEPNPVFCSNRLEFAADQGIGRDTACHGKDRRGWLLCQVKLQRPARFLGQHIGDGHLETCAQIGPVCWGQTALFLSDPVARPQQGGLEAGKGHVAPFAIQQGPWKRIPGCIAIARFGFDRRATRLWQTKKAGRLVKGFPGRIVYRASQACEIIGALHQKKLAMPTRNQQHQIGIVDLVGQARRQGMACKMVHADQGQTAADGQTLGAHDPRQYAANQAGSRGNRDGIHIRKRQSCTKKGLFHANINFLGMGPGSDLWHDTAECRMQLGLSQHYGRHDFRRFRPALANNRSRGIIAAAFQTQYRQRLGHRSFNPATIGPERCKTTGCEVTPDKDANNPGATMTRPVILLTRPEASSHRMAKLLSVAFGDRLDICISPLMEIVLDPRLPSLDGIRTLIFTSANGVAAYAAANGPKSLPCYTVGDATARAAAAAGLRATSAGGDADALVERIKQDKPPAPMLHVRGAHARGDIPERLGECGFPVAQAIVYHQNALNLTEEAKSLLDGDRPVILPLFSPRSAALMGSAPVSARVYAVAMSDATAASLRFDVEQMHVAGHPDFESMAKVVADLLDTTPWDKQMPL